MRLRIVPSPESDSARAYVERGLAVFTVLWQAGWIVGEIGVGVIAAGKPLATASLALTLLTLLGVIACLWGPHFLRAHLPLARGIDVAALGLATIFVATSVPIQPNAWPAGAQMAVVTAVAAALTCWLTPGIVCVIATASFSCLELIVGPVRAGSAAEAFKISLYAVALATGALVLAWGMRRTGRAMDVAHRQLAAATTESMAERVLEFAKSEHERVLHDTVLNTLSAIARGGLSGRTDDIRGRCAESAAELRRLDGSEVIPGSESLDVARRFPASVIAECDQLAAGGVRVALEGDDVDWASIPSAVSRALASATTEALRNVQRHSEASEVRVSQRCSDGFIEIVVSDDGIGGAAESPGRLGLSRSVRGAMADIGGVATIATAPGEGTRLSLSWRQAGQESTGDLHLAEQVLVVMPQITPVFILTFFSYSAIVLATSFREYAHPWLGLVALAVALAFAVPVGLVPRVAAQVGLADGRWLGPRTLLGLGIAAISAPIVIALENAAIAGRPMLPWEVWSSEMALALLFTTILLGPRWTIVVALASWVVAQGGDPWELIRPGSLMLVAAAVFADSMRRKARDYSRTLETLVATEAQLLSSREDVARRRRRYAALFLYTLPLLDAIADGSLDPMDPDVRVRCAEEERVARSIVRVDPDASPIAAVVYDMVVQGRERSVYFDAEVSALDMHDADRATTDARSLADVEHLVDALPAETTARVTGGWEDGSAVLRIVVPRVPGDMEFAPPPTDVDDEGTRLWEIVVAHA